MSCSSTTKFAYYCGNSSDRLPHKYTTGSKNLMTPNASLKKRFVFYITTPVNSVQNLLNDLAKKFSDEL